MRPAALLVLLVSGYAARAGAQSPADTVLYNVNNTATLSAVTNRATGAIGTIATLSFATSALARDPSTARLYYVSSTGVLGRVAVYDPATGTNTILNAAGSGGDNIIRLTFDGGVLYGIGAFATGSRLYTIDLTTGAYTNLGSVRIGSTLGPFLPNEGDIVFAPGSGILYAIANNPAGGTVSYLFSIDVATRVATQIGAVNPGGITLSALSYVGGTLYAGGASQLFTVNTTTGLGTLIASPAGVTYRDFATGPPVADLAVTAMTASGGWAVGTGETYTITVRNNGPFAATGVTLVDTLPTGIQYTGYTGAGWVCSAALQIVTCTRAAALPSATNAPLVLNVTVLNTVAPSITNVAVVSGTLADQNLANNRRTAITAVAVRRVTVTPDGATATQLPSNGTDYTQLFVVTNTGSQTGTYNLSATAAPAGVVTIVSVNGTAGSTGVTGSLPVLTGTANVPVVYSVATGAATGATATITLTATSTAAPVASDAGTLVVTVMRAGLSIAKQLYRDDQATLVNGAAEVSTGEYVQYRVAVTSTGAADATNVSVSDVVPAEVTYVTSTGDLPGWSFATAGPTLTATLAGTLATGTSRFFWIRVRVR
jgi:uncharacterized repeat protein (TIGR01451 family)